MGRALKRNPKPKTTEAAGARGSPAAAGRQGGARGAAAPARSESAQGRPRDPRRELEEGLAPRAAPCLVAPPTGPGICKAGRTSLPFLTSLFPTSLFLSPAHRGFVFVPEFPNGQDPAQRGTNKRGHWAGTSFFLTYFLKLGAWHSYLQNRGAGVRGDTVVKGSHSLCADVPDLTGLDDLEFFLLCSGSSFSATDFLPPCSPLSDFLFSFPSSPLRPPYEFTKVMHLRPARRSPREAESCLRQCRAATPRPGLQGTK